MSEIRIVFQFELGARVRVKSDDQLEGREFIVIKRSYDEARGAKDLGYWIRPAKTDGGSLDGMWISEWEIVSA